MVKLEILDLLVSLVEKVYVILLVLLELLEHVGKLVFEVTLVCMHGLTDFIGSTGLEISNQRDIITARDTRYIQREIHCKRFKIQNYWEEDRWRVKPD